MKHYLLKYSCNASIGGFEEDLDIIYISSDRNVIIDSIKYVLDDSEIETINDIQYEDFEFDDKEVSLFDGSDHVLLNMNLFKVIIEQLKELGWLE